LAPEGAIKGTFALMTRIDCYRELELSPDASAEQVRQAWKDLAQVWHPDRFGGNERLRAKAQERLKRINEAYQALKDGAFDGRGPGAEGVWEPSHYSRREQIREPLEVLAEGVVAWNLWRNKYSDVTPRLSGAKLKGRALEGVDFRDCALTGADLSGADLYKANLSRADLTRATLVEADLHRALLLETRLDEALLTQADLASADLRGASLARTQLQGARMIGARLEGADLSRSLGLTIQQLELCELDDDTRLPGRL
jgi:hypothetical protein